MLCDQDIGDICLILIFNGDCYMANTSFTSENIKACVLLIGLILRNKIV